MTGNTITEKYTDDFEILDQFQMIKSNLPPMSYENCVELDILTKEMVDYDIPSQEQCNIIEKFDKSKYKIHPWFTLVMIYMETIVSLEILLINT